VAKKSTSPAKTEEQSISTLVGSISRQGIVVRRERLASGHSFRVKSGRCSFSQERLLFVDRRLSPEQQLGVLIDFVLAKKLQLSDEELANLPPAQQILFKNTLPNAA